MIGLAWVFFVAGRPATVVSGGSGIVKHHRSDGQVPQAAASPAGCPAAACRRVRSFESGLTEPDEAGELSASVLLGIIRGGWRDELGGGVVTLSAFEGTSRLKEVFAQLRNRGWSQEAF